MKNITIGMDLGDKINLVCVLDNVGNVKQSISIENTMEALKAFFINFKGANLAILASISASDTT